MFRVVKISCFGLTSRYLSTSTYALFCRSGIGSATRRMKHTVTMAAFPLLSSDSGYCAARLGDWTGAITSGWREPGKHPSITRLRKFRVFLRTASEVSEAANVTFRVGYNSSAATGGKSLMHAHRCASRCVSAFAPVEAVHVSRVQQGIVAPARFTLGHWSIILFLAEAFRRSMHVNTSGSPIQCLDGAVGDGLGIYRRNPYPK